VNTINNCPRVVDLLGHGAWGFFGSCAPFLEEPEKLVIALLLHDRVTKNPAIARALG